MRRRAVSRQKLPRIVTGPRGLLLIGIVIGVGALVLLRAANHYTSTDSFCGSCHIHPQATSSWRLSTHYAGTSGTVTHCIECHLPPGGIGYIAEKSRLGVKDIFGKLFKDESRFNWEQKSLLEHAVTHTFRDACLECHKNLFPLELSKEGEEAHLHYTQQADRLRCINCHLHVGHFDPSAGGAIEFGLVTTEVREIYTEPAVVDHFEDYTEYIPGSSVRFEMVAIQGGTFTLGSPESEHYRGSDEGPTRDVTISPLWMGKAEVTWDEFETWYRQTAGEGRTDTRQLSVRSDPDIDAVTGATPPYGAPDQGWGKGGRPAITMTYHAATEYCKWLSRVTGKKYRLPTEAEWEYACRGGSSDPYFFEGDPGDYSEKRLWNRLFGRNTSGIDPYVIYSGNSGGKSQMPSEVMPNPFGFLNMSGNVREFCLDWYAANAYVLYPEGATVLDPRGPASGTEHVIRGGSFRSDAARVRSATRDHTRHDAWLMTDPQIPKSIWWYSDCIDVGFRVVCEYEEEGTG